MQIHCFLSKERDGFIPYFRLTFATLRSSAIGITLIGNDDTTAFSRSLRTTTVSLEEKIIDQRVATYQRGCKWEESSFFPAPRFTVNGHELREYREIIKLE
jgi:hypothetical protein